MLQATNVLSTFITSNHTHLAHVQNYQTSKQDKTAWKLLINTSKKEKSNCSANSMIGHHMISKKKIKQSRIWLQLHYIIRINLPFEKLDIQPCI